MVLEFSEKANSILGDEIISTASKLIFLSISTLFSIFCALIFCKKNIANRIEKNLFYIVKLFKNKGS